MEEFVGKLWHAWATKAAGGNYPEATVTLKEVEKTAGKKGKGGTAHAALDLIGKLYDVERQAEKQKLKPEQIATLRAEKSRPILDKLKALLGF